MMDERGEIVQYRLRRAYEALEDARFVRFDATQVGPWMENAEQFVKVIAALIDEPGS